MDEKLRKDVEEEGKPLEDAEIEDVTGGDQSSPPKYNLPIVDGNVQSLDF